MTLAIVAIIIAAAACVCVLFLYKRLVEKKLELGKVLQEREELLTNNIQLQTRISMVEQRLGEIQEERAAIIRELKAQHQSELEKQESRHKENLRTLESTLEKHFVNQKTALLNENKLLLTKDSKAILDEVFTPLKQRVEEYQKNLLQNEARLKENIDNAFKYSQEMNKSAQELGRILKGDKKLRGNFGELQLKNVLQSSGLIEGEQYKLQEHFRTQSGAKIPDAIVKLDAHRSIIIDAKFPLPNTLELSGDEIDSTIAQEIATNLRNRINELADKSYRDFAPDTYDFVLLFVPYNNIVDLALSVDNTLYQYAYNKQVYLTTPQTLFMALKTIAITWQHIESDSNIQKAFLEIGALYDKFAGVCEDFERLTRSLSTTANITKSLESKLRGKGGLESRFDKLKALGAKHNKTIPAHTEQNYAFSQESYALESSADSNLDSSEPKTHTQEDSTSHS